MDPVSYESLRKRSPELKLPAWRELRNTDRHKAKRLSVDRLVANRAALLLRRDIGMVDRGRPSWEHPMARNDAMAGHWRRFLTPIGDSRVI